MKTILGAAKEYVDGVCMKHPTRTTANHLSTGFHQGARFTQTWINVDDELPPTEIKDELNVVLGKLDNDYPFTVVYDSLLNEWRMFGTGIPLNIVKWRPIDFRYS